MTAQNTAATPLGANCGPQGTTFAVWAPNATAVFVTGEFNDWHPRRDPLVRGDDDCWRATVAAARAGQQYKYVIVNGDREFTRIDPWAREVTHSMGNGVICPPLRNHQATPLQLPPLPQLVIYELHVGTFSDHGDGKPGSFLTALDKLDHLQRLGINAIEVMPAMEFRGGRSWGYNPAQIYAIESDYGGPEAFQTFIQAAHDRGIAVFLDVVYNHLGPDDLDLWQFDGWSENDKGGIYFYNDWRSTTPWGETRPDYGRPEVVRYLHDNAFFWLERLGLDGLRWDATAFIRNVQGHNDDPEHDLADGWRFMQAVNDELHQRCPGRPSIAEDVRDNAALVRPTDQDGAGFDTQWDNLFAHQVRAALTCPEDQWVDLAALRAVLEHRFDDDPWRRVIYTESHDEVAGGQSRIPEEIAPDDAANWAAKKLSTLGAALLLTAPGVPMLFQGQEFLEDDSFFDRDALDWSKVQRFAGIVQLYRDLIGWRRNTGGVTAGLQGPHVAVHHANDTDKVMAYHRWDRGGPGDSVVVVVNLGYQPQQDYRLGMPAAGRWAVRCNTDARSYDESFGDAGPAEVMAQPEEQDGLPASATLSMGGYSALILSQDVAPA